MVGGLTVVVPTTTTLQSSKGLAWFCMVLACPCVHPRPCFSAMAGAKAIQPSLCSDTMLHVITRWVEYRLCCHPQHCQAVPCGVANWDCVLHGPRSHIHHAGALFCTCCLKHSRENQYDRLAQGGGGGAGVGEAQNIIPRAPGLLSIQRGGG